MTELEQLKAKYPLAFDTIKLPVRYVDEYAYIVGKDNQVVLRLESSKVFKKDNWERQDQIGELIVELINQLQ